MATKQNKARKPPKEGAGKEKLNRIKVVLVEKDKSQKWLAEKMNVGDNTVWNWTSNTTQPRLSELKDIAKLLGVSMCDLLNEQ